MYHQFKELAGIDITKEAMEVGPTTHYAMGGVRVDAESQMSSVPGLYAAGECAVGLHGANRLGGNSLSDLLVFGKRAGEYAAAFAKEQGEVRLDETAAEAGIKEALQPLEREGGEGPYQIQYALQDLMQQKVGIVRVESELEEAVEEIGALSERAQAVSAPGNREYNPGWHTALDLHNLMVVSEAVARAGLMRRESRGAQFRDDYPQKDEHFGKVNIRVAKGPDGEMVVEEVPVAPMSDELTRLVEEMG